jgi:hypothetical protein
VHPSKLGRLRQNGNSRVEKPQIVTVSRPAHQPVRTELDGVLVAVLAAMADPKDAQEILNLDVAAIEYIVRVISRG